MTSRVLIRDPTRDSLESLGLHHHFKSKLSLKNVTDNVRRSAFRSRVEVVMS